MIRLTRPRSKNQWIVLLLGVPVAVGSAVALAQGVNSLAWPKVDGVITYSGDKPGFRIIGVDVRYRYTTGGATYTGSRYRFQFVTVGNRMRGRDVQLAVGRYPAGERVKVAVNPRDPADSVLVPGPDPQNLVPLVLGLLLTLLGIGEVRKKQEPGWAAAYPVPARPRYRMAKVMAAAGVAMLLLAAPYVYQGINSTSWPVVEGRILYSHARSGRHPETLLWYEYYVDNQRYRANNYRTGGNVTPFRAVAEAAAKRYPAGRRVRVYYNPRNPREALLEPGVWWGNFVLPALGGLVLAAAWVAKKYAEAVAGRAHKGKGL